VTGLVEIRKQKVIAAKTGDQLQYAADQDGGGRQRE